MTTNAQSEPIMPPPSPSLPKSILNILLMVVGYLCIAATLARALIVAVAHQWPDPIFAEPVRLAIGGALIYWACRKWPRWRLPLGIVVLALGLGHCGNYIMYTRTGDQTALATSVTGCASVVLGIGLLVAHKVVEKRPRRRC